MVAQVATLMKNEPDITKPRIVRLQLPGELAHMLDVVAAFLHMPPGQVAADLIREPLGQAFRDRLDKAAGRKN